MKLIKTTTAFALLFVTLTFNSYTSEKPTKSGWLTYASATLLNGYSGFKQFLSYATNQTSSATSGPNFLELPEDMRTTIIQLFAKSCTDTSLKDAAQTINALTKVNTYLNSLINDPLFCLKLIKSRAKQFNVSDIAVAKALQTKESKKRLTIQLSLAKIIKDSIAEQENNGFLPLLNKLVVTGFGERIKRKADVNFTYVWDQNSQEYLSPLMYAVQNDNRFFINYLLKNNANINQAGFNGKTPLMYANDPTIIKLLAQSPGLNSNQQDQNGNTALLRAIENYFPEDEENRDNNLALIQQLVDIGVNPEIANNNGNIPLKAAEATGDQAVIDIIKDAID